MLIKDYLKDKTDDQLKAELKELNCSINKVGCFGVNDLLLRDKIMLEIETRKTLRLIEKVRERVAKHFPARHWAHVEVFNTFWNFQKTFEERARE